MALDILSMPIIRRPKPIRIVPTPFFRSDLQKVYKTIPRKARMGLKFAGFSISISNPVPCTPSRLRIHAVTVVPTLEPKITPMACCSVMTPLLTKPTTITVVAPELWITAVTAIPSKKPFRGLPVKAPRIFWSLPPACFCRDLLMVSMPNRNIARPPSRRNTWNISNFLSPPCFTQNQHTSPHFNYTGQIAGFHQIYVKFSKNSSKGAGGRSAYVFYALCSSRMGRSFWR